MSDPKPDKNGWLPIKTAPRDGTSILVYAPGEPHGIPVVACGNKWIDPEGWEFFSSPQVGRLTVYATHWQPLPKPPEAG